MLGLKLNIWYILFLTTALSRVLEKLSDLSKVLQQISGRGDMQTQSPKVKPLIILYFLPEAVLLVRRSLGCFKITPEQMKKGGKLYIRNLTA